MHVTLQPEPRFWFGDDATQKDMDLYDSSSLVVVCIGWLARKEHKRVVVTTFSSSAMKM
jgi:hypothetical protein